MVQNPCVYVKCISHTTCVDYMDLGHHHNVGFPVGANFEHGVAGSSTLIHTRTSSSVTLKTIYYILIVLLALGILDCLTE